MQGFTILGDGDNKAILPKSLLGTLREAQIALRELDNAKEVDIDSITSLKDIEIEKEQFVEALYYAFFHNVAKNKATLSYDKNAVKDLDSIDSITRIFKQANNNQVPFLQTQFRLRGISLSYYIIGCFQALCGNGTTLEYENLLPKSLLPTGVNLKDALPELIHNIPLKNRAKSAIFNEQGILHKNDKTPSYPDDFISTFPEFLELLSSRVQSRYDIDFIAILTKVFMDGRFFPLLMQENTKEEGLTITDFTLRIVEQTMQADAENMSLKSALEDLFAIDDEATWQKLAGLLHTDSKLCLLREKECMEHEFAIPDEYREDIVSALEGVFERGYNASQEFHSLFEKFENILIGKSDYASYSESEKEVVATLRTMHTTLTNALIALNDLLNAQSDTSPRAQRRLYLKHINDLQSALATLPLSNAHNASMQASSPKEKSQSSAFLNAALKEAECE